jgi:hypothetical protein
MGLSEKQYHEFLDVVKTLLIFFGQPAPRHGARYSANPWRNLSAETSQKAADRI